MSAFLSLLQTLDGLLSKVVRGLCIVAMAAIFVMFILNVFVRFVPVYNFTQTDDWIQFALVWMIFLGAQELVRTRNHFVVDFMTERLQNRTLANTLRVVVCLIELATYAVICWYGWIWVLRSNATMQSIPWMEVRYMYAAIPISFFFMVIYAIRDVLQASFVFLSKESKGSV